MINIIKQEITFDESSPHLHIVGVTFKDSMKNDMENKLENLMSLIK